ncbi:MAG: asparagine--tRNA ligase [Chlamydiia bacterium]|nr:asparagine--tRNA ligase [Chlamydiia bacterium]
MKRSKIKTIKQEKKAGEEALVKGWVRTVRHQKNFSFIELNDGSTLSCLQIIADSSLPNYTAIVERLATGASCAVAGILVESLGTKQAIELHAKEIEIIGECDSQHYPLQKKRHSFEFLRTIAHLRPRTNTIGAVMRVRNVLAFATHVFFQERGFIYLHTPIITASDCEGAGELFNVSTLDKEDPPRNKRGEIDHSHDFFGKLAYLTVSGQLNGESYACALSDIYTFGPTFRAENSNTSRHLAEFWMIEPEMAFADLSDTMDLAQIYLKYLIGEVLIKCPEEMEFFDRVIRKGTIARLQEMIDKPFQKISYIEAVEQLAKSGRVFEFPCHFGCDLQSEHERYLCEEVYKGPIILYDFPKAIKAFYMRENEDGKTVAAMDVLFPGVGEIIGGSQREDRHAILVEKMDRMGLDKEPYWWYLELRKYGSVPHAGFGLGFERLIQFVTGMENIRDVIPFPRTPNHAPF